MNWTSFDDAHPLSTFGTPSQPIDADQRTQVEAREKRAEAQRVSRIRKVVVDQLRGNVAELHRVGLVTAVASRRVKKVETLSAHQQGIWNVAVGALEGISYCRELDRAGVRPPWVNKGCPSKYVEAYRDDRWRNRIKLEKSRVLKKAQRVKACHDTQN